MRSSPEGSKLLYDSLSRTAGLTVSRNYFPLEYLEDTSATIFLLGLNAAMFDDSAAYIEPVEQLR